MVARWATGSSAAWVGAGNRVTAWSRTEPADRVRLGVKSAGVYAVSSGEIAAALGVASAQVSAALAATNLALSCQGHPVAWNTCGNELLFYGVPPSSRWAPENVYWIQPGVGEAIANAGATGGNSGTNGCFRDIVTVQGTNDASYLTVGTLTNVPSYLAFKLLTAGKAFSVTASVPDACEGMVTGIVTVVLYSAHELGSDTHAARVSVNGVAVGSPEWSGEQCLTVSYPFSGVALTGGVVVVKVENLLPSGTSARFFWSRLSVNYPRRYRARDDLLLCAGGEEGLIDVQGFTSCAIAVWDVTAPVRPEAVTPCAIESEPNGNTWRVVFPCGGADRRYAVFAFEGGLLRPSVRGVCDGDGFAADGVADYVALIPPEGWVAGFRETVRPLVEFRARQGLRTWVMDVEALYNRFSHGLADPFAIREFCAVGRAGSGVQLRYLLLAGSGSLDYRHERTGVTDYNACLIPPLVAPQRFDSGEAMVVAVDQAFGDVSGDAAPEVSVGRLPTALTQELAVAVGKTLAYETAASWKGRAAVSADWDYMDGGNLLALTLVGAGKRVRTFYPATSASALLPVWQSELQPDLQEGDGVFWFIGHSGAQSLGGNAFSPLVKNSTLQITAWPRVPIAVLIGCHVNRWHLPAVAGADAASLGPFGVFLSGSGFAAALAATGYVADGVDRGEGEGQTFARFLGEASATNGVYRIGDAVCLALRRLAVFVPEPTEFNLFPAAITPERLQSLCLTGDPALSWRHDATGTGTPAVWLTHYGLVSWDGDVSDTDCDGFAAWQEYRFGTRPDTNRLAIAMHGPETGGEWMRIGFESVSNGHYAVQWKPALTGTDVWQPVSWAWPGQTDQPKGAAEPIPADAPVTAVCVPFRPGDTQAFYRIIRFD